MAKKVKLIGSLKLLMKLSLAAALILWMLRTGKLDLKQLSIFIQRFDILTMNILVWSLGALLAGSVRWHVLLHGLGVVIEYTKTLRLHLIGFFFSTAMPGAVGGDLIKAVYIIRAQKKGKKTPALLSILLDRILGLFGLFTVGVAAILWNFQFIRSNKALFSFAVFIVGVFSSMLLIAILAFQPFRTSDPILKILSLHIPGLSFVRNVYLAFRNYRERPWTLLAGWGLSIFIHSLMIFYFWTLTDILTGSSMGLASFLVLFPIGMLTVALPIAPGGLGVGHAAFEELFALVGVAGGANVFNIYFLGQMSLNILGFLPYLAMRSEGLKVSQEDTEGLLNSPDTQPSTTRTC